MKATADMYTYRVFWSGEDGAFVASVSEFPSLSNVADSQKEALNGLSELVADVLADMRESGEQPPVPLGCRTYSGKYALRMTPEQHRRVVMEAAEQGVSDEPAAHLARVSLACGRAVPCLRFPRPNSGDARVYFVLIT